MNDLTKHESVQWASRLARRAYGADKARVKAAIEAERRFTQHRLEPVFCHKACDCWELAFASSAQSCRVIKQNDRDRRAKRAGAA